MPFSSRYALAWADGEVLVVENRRREDRVRATFGKRFVKVVEIARAARSDHREPTPHRRPSGEAPGRIRRGCPSASMLFITISPAPSSTPSSDHSSTSLPVLRRPPCRPDLPSCRRAVLYPQRVDRKNDALASKPFGAFADEVRVIDGGCIQRHLVGSGAQHLEHVVRIAQPAADRERDKDLRGDLLKHLAHDAAALGGGGYGRKRQARRLRSGCSSQPAPRGRRRPLSAENLTPRTLRPSFTSRQGIIRRVSIRRGPTRRLR